MDFSMDTGANGMFQSVDPIKSNPFWSGVMAGQNQAQAQPTLDLNRASQMMGVQREAQQNQEFMSPEALAARKSTLESTTAKNKADIETLPWKTKGEIEKAKADLENLPYITAAEKAKAVSLRMEHEGKPTSDLLNTLGNRFESFNKAKPEEREGLWNNTLKEIEDTHPGYKVPEQYRQWDPSRIKDLATARLAQVNTAEQAQRLEQERVKGGFEVQAAGVHAGATRYAADVGAASHERIATADREYGKGVSSPAQLRQLQTIMNDPNADPQKQETAKAMLHDSAQKEADAEIAKDAGIKGLGEQMIMSSDPTARQQLLDKIDERKASIRTDKLLDRGLMKPLSEQFALLKQKYPNKSDAELKAAFKRKTGKQL